MPTVVAAKVVTKQTTVPIQQVVSNAVSKTVVPTKQVTVTVNYPQALKPTSNTYAITNALKAV